MKIFMQRILFLFGLICCFNAHVYGQKVPDAKGITTPLKEFGFNVCDDYCLVNYVQLTDYWHKLEKESDRVKVVSIGKSEEGREQWMAIITSPENFKKLDYYRKLSTRLARARGLTDKEARAMAKEGKAIIWIDGGIHSSELLTAQVIVEHVYRMAAKNDDETKRILDDVIQLIVLANPDGLDLLANNYMNSSKVPTERKQTLPHKMYQKYAEHDNNRDLYMNALAETKNMSKIMYREWNPQIVCNHHQAGPGIIDIQSTCDPYNYYLNPLALATLRALSGSLATRFVAENKPGVNLRNYGTLDWDCAMSEAPYYHNAIGLLFETEGDLDQHKYMYEWSGLNPSETMIQPLTGQWVSFKTGMEYDLTANWGVLDYASRMRSDLLYNIYQMGRDSIQRGSQDHWTMTFFTAEKYRKAVEALPRQPQSFNNEPDERRAQELAKGKAEEKAIKDANKPEERDPRAYILPSNQPDFLTATRFVNSLIESGLEVEYAKSAFSVQGHSYPAGSYVVKTAQAFRPHVLNMFEPKRYEKRLLEISYFALQMGVKFDRILEGFDYPAVEILEPLKKPPLNVTLPSADTYRISRAMTASFKAINRLVGQKQKVFAADQYFYVPATNESTEILRKLVQDDGFPVEAAVKQDIPQDADALVKPYKVGLLDVYYGRMPAGWIRWLFEQYEVPFEVVYAATLNTQDLSQYDALVLPVMPDGVTIPDWVTPEKLSAKTFDNDQYIPEEYRKQRGGNITQSVTMPRLKDYVKQGGRIVAIGSCLKLCKHFDLPVTDYLADSTVKRFGQDMSVMEISLDNKQQAALGMDSAVAAMFSGEFNVMKLPDDAAKRGLQPIAWFSKSDPLLSGWVQKRDYLKDGVVGLKAQYGKGSLYLYSAEITFRGQCQGNLKLVFNGMLGR